MRLQLPVRNAMRRFSLIVFSFVLLVTVSVSYAQTVTTNTQSTHNGFFYSFWNDGSKGSASMTLGPAGNYSTTWSNIGNFTAGKGWAVGKPDRVVCFSGNFDGGSNGFLALYGWTKNALIEYYVCENYGAWTPPGNTSGIVNKGTYTCDGGTYTIYTATRTNQPSIVGTATFQQFWSVRTQKRSSGTITFATHVAAWKAAGMNMGTTWDYQIMESEGYNSSGSSNITVSECVSCATPAPTTITSFDYEVGAAATQLTATGTALKWYTVATGGTALSSAPTPNTATAGTTKYYVGQTLNGCEGPRTEITVRVSQKYKIFKVSSPIIIDGTLEATWSNASVLPAAATKLIAGAVTNSTDLSGNFKALWDDTYLYVLADVTDDVKMNESTNVYDDDGVEVYVDINNDKATTYGANDVQYTFGWNDGTTVGVLPSGRATTGITYAAVARTGGYIVEARIPWTTLKGTPAIGQLVGMDFMINDDDDGGTRDGKLAWNASEDDAWENPSLFGTAVLQGLLPCSTPAAPTVVTPVAYCQNATAAALTATGTSLLWYTNSTGGTGTASLTPVTTAAGTATYYVSQNVGGCESARAPIVVNVNALPTAVITAGSATTFCAGGSVTLTAGNGTEYVWKNGTTQVGTASTYTATTSGSYTVEITNTNNCKATSTATAVTVNAAPAAPTVTAPAAYCQNAASSALTATGTALKWYDAATGGTSSASVTPNTATVGTKNYYVSQTTNGCESPRAQVAVTVNALPTAVITAGSATTFCTGGSVTLTAGNGTGYVWKNGTTQVGITSTYTATTSGSYTVEITNTNNCKATSTATAVTVNAAPAAPTVTAPAAYCQNAASSALTATGTALKWYDAATGGTSSASVTPNTATVGTINYYVSQTTNGCESPRAQVAVTVNALPAAAITVIGSTSIVQGGSVTLNAPAGTGLSYKWFKGTNQVGTAAASYTATAEGNYTVEVTNAAGCKAISPVTTITQKVNQPSVITITSPVTNTTVSSTVTITADISDADGSIKLVEYLVGDTVIGSSISEPYSFTWNDVSAGLHTITIRVTDSQDGITTSSPVTVFAGVTTGITSGNSMQANVYPVPAKDELIVETEVDLSEASFRITNALGEEVFAPIQIAGTNAKVNVSTLAEGAYVLVIRQGSNVLTKKIILTY
jgi:hypothetical protein